MEDTLKQLVGEQRMGQLSEKSLEKDGCSVNISAGELNFLPFVDSLNIILNCCLIRRTSEMLETSNNLLHGHGSNV